MSVPVVSGDGRVSSFDALRGLAALAVVFFHFGLISQRNWASHGYLAVDFFFQLSGYVLAMAYGAKLAGGMTLRRFFRIRFVRLYPLILVGVATEVVLHLIIGLRSGSFDLTMPVVAFALLVVPDLTHHSADPFSLLSPSWSLFYEIVVNIIWAATLTWLRPSRLTAVILVSGIVLGVLVYTTGNIQFGSHYGTELQALVRTIFSFSLGLLLYRTRNSQPRLGGMACAALAVLSAAVLMAPSSSLDWGIDYLAVTAVFPLLIIAASRTALPGIRGLIAALLGDLSYPIYILHFPLRGYFLLATGLVHLAVGWQLPLYVATVLVTSYAALVLYDRPIQAAAKRPRPSQGLVPAAPAGD